MMCEANGLAASRQIAAQILARLVLLEKPCGIGDSQFEYDIRQLVLDLGKC